jgi:nicotinamidase/pyrazinamidase
MEYSPTTALLVVDVQNDFAQPAGSLYVFGAEATIPFINTQIEAARDAGAMIVYTQDWHPWSTPHFAKDGGIWPVHCVGDTWGAELHPDLLVDGARIRKGTGGEDGYSGFSVRHPVTGDESPTELEGMLRDREVTRVVVVGLATDYCVKETAIDAACARFATTLLADGIRAVNLEPGDGARAVAAMATAGVAIE